MAPKQMSLSMAHDAGFERHRKPTRRDVFLAKMDQVVPWSALCAVIVSATREARGLKLAFIADRFRSGVTHHGVA